MSQQNKSLSKHQLLKKQAQTKKTVRFLKKHPKFQRDIFVIGLDIDETIMNSKTMPVDLIDINGSNQYDDASAWTNFLQSMKEYGFSQGVELVVQLISAKINATDDTVEILDSKLSNFLEIRDENNTVFTRGELGFEDSDYVLRRYTKGNAQSNYKYNKDDTVFFEEFNAEFLPPIHLCFANGSEFDPTYGNRASKVLVLDKIREHFGIPHDHLCLIDNDLGHIAKVKAAGYIGISSNELAVNIGSSQSDKEIRTKACESVLKEAACVVKASIDSIVEDRLNRLKKFRPAFFKNVVDGPSFNNTICKISKSSP